MAAFGTCCHKVFKFLGREDYDFTCTSLMLQFIRQGFDIRVNTKLDLGKAKNSIIRTKTGLRKAAAVLNPSLCCGACKWLSSPLAPCPGNGATSSLGAVAATGQQTALLILSILPPGAGEEARPLSPLASHTETGL